jgi:hypothetical protein
VCLRELILVFELEAPTQGELPTSLGAHFVGRKSTHECVFPNKLLL